MTRRAGWTAFAAWALAGALLVFSVLSGFSIGLFILPLALIAIAAVAWRAAAWPESVGAVAGAGTVCLLIAFLSRDYDPCPQGRVRVLRPGETSVECGGMDPVPWLVIGIVLVAIPVASHAAMRRRSRRV